MTSDDLLPDELRDEIARLETAKEQFYESRDLVWVAHYTRQIEYLREQLPQDEQEGG